MAILSYTQIEWHLSAMCRPLVYRRQHRSAASLIYSFPLGCLFFFSSVASQTAVIYGDVSISEPTNRLESLLQKKKKKMSTRFICYQYKSDMFDALW